MLTQKFAFHNTSSSAYHSCIMNFFVFPAFSQPGSRTKQRDRRAIPGFELHQFDFLSSCCGVVVQQYFSHQMHDTLTWPGVTYKTSLTSGDRA